jgi:hypothetical protein
MIRRFLWWEPKYPNAHWTDPVTGYGIQVRFNDLTKTWCGYVVLPDDHPWTIDQRRFEQDDKQPYIDLDFWVPVHGGWTYRSGNTLGFDCAHHTDYLPTQTYSILGKSGTYWTFAMVRDEILRAAREIHELR